MIVLMLISQLDRLFDGTKFNSQGSIDLLSRLDSIPKEAISKWKAIAATASNSEAAITVIDSDNIFTNNVFQQEPFARKLDEMSKNMESVKARLSAKNKSISNVQPAGFIPFPGLIRHGSILSIGLAILIQFVIYGLMTAIIGAILGGLFAGSKGAANLGTWGFALGAIGGVIEVLRFANIALDWGFGK
jgi:hypothetical protein